MKVRTRVKLEGNKQKAAAFTRRGLAQMRILSNMSSSRLKQDKMKRTLMPGLTVTCSKMFGLEEVTIFADPEIFPIENRVKICPKVCGLHLGFIIRLFDQEYGTDPGDLGEMVPTTWPDKLYQHQQHTFDVLVCMGEFYELWEECFPVDFFLYDHAIAEDADENQVLLLKPGSPVFCTPCEVGGKIERFFILNIFPEASVRKWETVLVP